MHSKMYQPLSQIYAKRGIKISKKRYQKVVKMVPERVPGRVKNRVSLFSLNLPSIWLQK